MLQNNSLGPRGLLVRLAEHITDASNEPGQDFPKILKVAKPRLRNAIPRRSLFVCRANVRTSVLAADETPTQKRSNIIR